MAGRGRNEDGNELDVMALLHEVHGTADGARGAAVDAALRTLEVTHRRASLAMRAFEQEGNPSTGRAPKAGGDPGARLAGAAASAPAARPAQARPPLPAPETTAIWRPEEAQAPTPSDLPRPASHEATAVGPTPHQAATSVTDRPTHDDAARHASATAPAPDVDVDVDVDVYAGRGANWSLREPTKTQRVPRPKK